jgi:acetoin utilization deacetylase AcuC-like enzyme
MCAKLSAGACVDVATAVVRGEAAAGVAVVRPPGHHAESNTAMGFCFFNNAGIAARAAQVRPPAAAAAAAAERRAAASAEPAVMKGSMEEEAGASWAHAWRP